MNSQNVFTLHDQGKFICYYSELDPFSNKWLGIQPEVIVKEAIKDIKTLCLVFDHVIIPPGYLLKSPVTWIILSHLKPLFEYGLLSISIDQAFSTQPFLFFEQKLEEDVFSNSALDKSSDAHHDDLKKQLKALIQNGYFLFRDSSVQTVGFGTEAENLSKSLAQRSREKPKALLEGIERIKGEDLLSSRDHWIALLQHPSYHPPPDVVREVSRFIHHHYFSQGWIGNHCKMYPSEFITTTFSSGMTRFPLSWFAYHVSVISNVIMRYGIDPHSVHSLPLGSFIKDIALAPEIGFWRQVFHEEVSKLDKSLIADSAQQSSSGRSSWAPSFFTKADRGKQIAERLIENLRWIEEPMRESVCRLLLKARLSASSAAGTTPSAFKAPPLLPGASFLDLKIRMVCTWQASTATQSRHWCISYMHREIRSPDGKMMKMDRAPFQLFMALLHKHGDLLDRDVGTLIVERITREALGPIMLHWLDPLPDVRCDKPISYAEMNQIVLKLRRLFKKLGLEGTLETVKGRGWRLKVSAADFIFKDIPVVTSGSDALAYLSIDLTTKKIHYKDKYHQLSPLPFDFLQLLLRYSGMPVNVSLINKELKLMVGPLSKSNQEYKSVRSRINQYVKILRKALAAIQAPIAIDSEYGVGWYLSFGK